MARFPLRVLSIGVTLLVSALLAVPDRLFADAYDPPANYYATAVGTGTDLKTQLHNIIKGHTAALIRLGAYNASNNRCGPEQSGPHAERLRSVVDQRGSNQSWRSNSRMGRWRDVEPRAYVAPEQGNHQHKSTGRDRFVRASAFVVVNERQPQ